METLIYLGKVNLYWILLYTCYHVLLRKHTFFELNRSYLVGSLAVAFLLPLVIYPETAPAIPVVYEVNAATFIVSPATSTERPLVSWTEMAWLLYAAGALFMAFKLAQHLLALRRFLNMGEVIDLEDCTIVLIDSDRTGSFSFLKWIVINRHDYEANFDTILRHEMTHSSQWHSVDILLVEVLKVVFWFNPVLLFYKSALQEVHEFLADAKAQNKETYATFLVSYALNAPIASLTNHFFKPSQIKTRVVMIYKNRSSRWLLGTYLVTLLTIGFIALFIAGCEDTTTPELNESKTTGKAVVVEGEIKGEDGKALPGANVVVNGKNLGATTDVNGKFTLKAPDNGELVVSLQGHKTRIIEVKNSTTPEIKLKKGDAGLMVEGEVLNPEIIPGKVFTVVEQQPTFPGGTRAMYEFLGNNIKYPKAASDARISGKVFLSFVVGVDGSIKDVMVLKGLGFGCDAEAVRVLKLFPKWNPGMQDGVPVNVKYNLPINFQLEDASETNLEQVNITAPKNALYIIDGKEIENFKTESINPNSIESIDVLKNDEQAVRQYGAKAKNGVIRITTKKN
jgi:TonB family protein